MRCFLRVIILAAFCAFVCALTTRAEVNVPIGDLAPAETIIITYDVTINNPLPPGTTQLSSQGTVSGTGFSVLTDDPDTSAPNDPTITTFQNLAPVAGTDTIQRAPNDDVKVKIATLLLNDSDPDNGTLSIFGVVSPTPNGATVAISGDWVLYKHAGTTADSFTYTLTDGQGGSTPGTVSVLIQGQDTQAGPALQLTVGGSITFHSLPGRTYIMQKAPAATGPWDDDGTATESTRGVYTYTATPGFYRAVYR